MEPSTPSDQEPAKGRFARLVPRDVLRFDPEQRQRYIVANGQEPAADVTLRTRDELAHLLHTATIAHHSCGFEELSQSARRIRRLAVQAGLPDLARAGDHVLDCIVQCDSAALGATVARLHRLGLLALAELTT
jgi:hypothetical protein